MIVDCFTFFNELDLLELRLTVLDDVVDRFVLCEAPFTFRGNPKPLVYAENKQRFARWAERIVHLVYDPEPDANPWKNEWGQRGFLTSAVKGLASSDLILIGDVDEIPAPEIAPLHPAPGRVLAHQQLQSIGYVNRIVNRKWIGTKAVERGTLGDRTLNDIRTLPSDAFDVIESGWHLSSLGGWSVQVQKLHAFSHSEMDVPYLADPRRVAVQYDSESEAEWVPLDGTFGAKLQDPRWAPYVWTAPAYARDEAERLMHAQGCFASVPDDGRPIAAVTASPATWQGAGAERFGTRFVGAFETPGEVRDALPRGGWAVLEQFGEWLPSDLAILAQRGIGVIAYAPNARSFLALKRVLDGGSFPPGPARGLLEIEAEIAQAGFTVRKRDEVMYSVFDPALLDREGTFEAFAMPFGFASATREQIVHFSAYAYVFTLQSADG